MTVFATSAGNGGHGRTGTTTRGDEEGDAAYSGASHWSAVLDEIQAHAPRFILTKRTMSAWERHPPAWQQQTWACSPARSPRFRRVSTTTSTPTSRNDKTQAVFFLLTFRGPRWPLLSSTLNSSAAMTSFPDQRRHHSGLMDIDPLLHISHRDKSPEDSGRELWARSQVLGRSSSLPRLGRSLHGLWSKPS